MKLTTYLAVAAFASGILLTSCYKKKDTVAVVRVVDINGANVNNAQVILYGTPTQLQGTPVVRDTAYTNSAGEATFKYNDIYQSGQVGVAVLDIEVTKGGATSLGIIKIEQEATTTEKVIL